MSRKKTRGSNSKPAVQRVKLPVHPVATMPLQTEPLPDEPVTCERYIASACVGETSVTVTHEDYQTCLDGLVYCLNRLDWLE